MNYSPVIPNSWHEVLSRKKPLVCAVLNITPDSFSDGGKYLNENSAIDQINLLIDQGAQIIDVGAESTRLNASEVPANEEISRLNQICKTISSGVFGEVLFSVDTRHHETAEFAMESGFAIINDVSAGNFDNKMFQTMVAKNALVVLMHSRGTPETMNKLCDYENVVDDVCHELEKTISDAITNGVRDEKIMIDPGIGFAKTPEQGLELLDNIDKIKKRLGFPMMVGVSRKTIVSYLMSGDPKIVPYEDRDDVSAEMSKYLIEHDVDVVRVHNVAKTYTSWNSQ